MVEFDTHLGNISISRGFFADLVGGVISDCFGVVGKNAVDLKQFLFSFLPFNIFKKNQAEKGVRVKMSDNKLFVDLHITVRYGVNISSVVESVRHKVRYAIEEETNLKVETVNVYIDGIQNN